jgi:hypothetical protein
MTQEELAEARREINARFGSIYKFCKATGLNRATVWMVLKGAYPGNVERQGGRILQALGKRREQVESIYEAIRGVACGRCSVINTARCNRCEGLFRAEAAAVAKALGLEETWPR